MINNINKNYIIRKAVWDDFMSIHNILFTTWLDTYPNKEFNITKEDIEFNFQQKLLPEEIAKAKIKNYESENLSNISRLILEFSNIPVGFCRSEEKENHNQLQAIYVLPKYHGMGFGYALWQEAKKIFNPKKDTIVHVASYNQKAINFYEKLGFKSTGKIFFDEKHKMRNGAMIPELEMVIENNKF